MLMPFISKSTSDRSLEVSLSLSLKFYNILVISISGLPDGEILTILARISSSNNWKVCKMRDSSEMVITKDINI
jgi:hypothetical protein